MASLIVVVIVGVIVDDRLDYNLTKIDYNFDYESTSSCSRGNTNHLSQNTILWSGWVVWCYGSAHCGLIISCGFDRQDCNCSVPLLQKPYIYHQLFLFFIIYSSYIQADSRNCVGGPECLLNFCSGSTALWQSWTDLEPGMGQPWDSALLKLIVVRLSRVQNDCIYYTW